MTSCEWFWFDVTWIGIALLAIVSIWQQRKAHTKRLNDERTRFWRADL